MDNLLFFVIGFVLAIILFKKPIQITIHHKNENIIPQLPEEIMPKMSDITHNADPEEDKAYEEMGKLMENINEVFGGSDRS